MRSFLVRTVVAAIALLGACGGDGDETDGTSARARGNAGGKGGASAGSAGSTSGGTAGIANAGAAGSTSAGAAGSTSAGAAGSTSAGAAGSTSAGAAGSTSAGAAGSSSAGAAGSTSAGAAGSGGGGGSGPADCTGTLPAGDRQLDGSLFMTNQTRSIDMTQFINIGESSAPGAAKNGYPGRTGNTWVPFIQREKFAAFAFQADLARGESQSFTIAETTVVTSAIFSLSISECPGDFRASLPDACIFVGGQGGIISARHPTENYPGVCMLRPGRTYYFNMIHRDATGASTCPEAAGFCGNLFVTYTD